MTIIEMLGAVLDIGKKREPEILSGIGIGSGVAAVILAIAATKEADKRLKAEQERKGRPLTATEKVKTTGVYYIPSILAEGISIYTRVKVNKEYKKSIASLGVAYTLADSTLRDYRKKVSELYGEKKEEKIRSEVNQEQLNRTPMPAEFENNPETDHPGHGDVRCYEHTCGRYFWSDRETIERAVNKLNWQMTRNMVPYISLNEFYMEIGLPMTEAGDKLGWNANKNMIEVEFDSRLKDGRYPCLMVVFSQDGKPDYGYEKA